MGNQTVTKNQTAQPLQFGPVVQTSDHNTPMTGLLTAALINQIGASANGTTTTIVTATNPNLVAGNTVTSLTGTAGNIGQSRIVTSVTGTGPYTINFGVAWPSATANLDTFSCSNTQAASGNGTTTTIVLANSPGLTLGQLVLCTSGSNNGVFSYYQSGTTTLVLSPALPNATATSDTFAFCGLGLVMAKNGSGFATPAAQPIEQGRGYYALAGNATDANTAGLIRIGWNVYGFIPGDQNEESIMVTGPDFLDAARAGLSALPTAAAGANGGLPTGDASGRVLLQPTQTGVTIPTVTTVGSVTGAVGSVTGAVGSITGITFPANFGTFSIDGSGRVTLTPAEHTAISGTDVPTALTAQGYTTTRAGFLDTLNGLVAAIWAAATRTLTAFGFAVPSVTGAVGSVTGAVGSVTGNVGGNVVGSVGSISGVTFPANFSAFSVDGSGRVTLTPAEHTGVAGDVLNATAASYNTAGTIGKAINSAGTASDPWATALPGSYGAGTAGALLGALTTTGIANAVLAAAVDGSITLKQAQELQLAVMAGKFSSVSSGGTVTTTYYKQDGTTIIAVGVSSGTPVVRTWTFTNL